MLRYRAESYLCLSHRSFAKKVCVFYQSCGIYRLVGNLMQNGSALTFYPTPIAKLVKFKVGSVEKIHCLVVHESVRHKRNTAIRESFKTAVEIHIVKVGAVESKILDIRSSDLIRRYDKVYRSARHFFDAVDSRLNGFGGNACRIRNLIGV